VAIVLGLLRPALADASATKLWKNINEWSIKIDSSLGDTCYMTKISMNGHYIRAQLSDSLEVFHFAVGKPEWTFIERGKFYDISIQFGDQNAWHGQGYGIWFDSMPAYLFYVGFAERRAERFIKEFSYMNKLRLSRKNEPVSTIYLEDTFSAMKELFACQESMFSGKIQ
jgi:hypothetical protein